MPEHTYSIVPYSGYGAVLAGLLVLVPLLLLGYMNYSARYATFTVSPEGLRIRGDIYGRFVPAAKIRTREARVVENLDTDAQFGLTWRTNGASFPGYKAGWFRTKAGGKALAFVTDKSRVAAVPTTDGYTVLMSVADPQSFVQDLQNTLDGQRF
jgi:hypothetical protein